MTSHYNAYRLKTVTTGTPTVTDTQPRANWSEMHRQEGDCT